MSVWRYIDERDVSAAYGLATDEYLTDIHTAESTPGYPVALRLYNYADYSALCGRFQNISAEIDIEGCQARGYGYGRRLTGGGAIVMGQSQLGVCLTTHADTFPWKQVRDLYGRFSEPIIDMLDGLGIPATFRSKNDLEVNGKKIAGLGVYISPSGGVQFHCSLLADLDISAMIEVLKIPIQKYDDKLIQRSVSQRLTNIRTETGMPIELDELKDRLKRSYADSFGAEMDHQPLMPDEKARIDTYIQDRYASDEWIYQRSPRPDMNGVGLKKTPMGLLRTYIGLKGETIKSVMVTGDYVQHAEVFAQVESSLKWSDLNYEKIKKTIIDVVNRELPEGKRPAGWNTLDIVDAIWIAGQRALAANKYTYNGSCYYPKLQEA